MKIVIIGAGIIGITTAVRLVESFQDVDITIISEDFSPNTTSNVSAGWWKPSHYPGLSDETNKKWCFTSYNRMINEAFSENAYKMGIQIMNTYVMEKSEDCQVPFFADVVANFTKLTQRDIDTVCSKEGASDIKSGYSYTGTTITTNKYLSFYTKFLENNGVQFVEKKLTKLHEFISDSKKEDEIDFIINCCGLGARTFCDDLNMFSVQGQVLRVKAPWIKHVLCLDNALNYIVPLSDLVVLGGVKKENEYHNEPNDEDCKNIFERCCKLIPSLKDAEIVGKQSGLRPMRTGGPRLELEKIKKEDKMMKVIHNYGHGPSGVILSWGSANDVIALIKSNLESKLDLNLESSLSEITLGA